MSEMRKGPTGRYSIIQGGYWINFLILTGFAAVFLNGRGFNARQIGTVTAIGSLLSCLLQQYIGTKADQSIRPLKWMAAGFLILCMAAPAALVFLPHTYLSSFVFFAAAYTLEISFQPLLSSLCLQFSDHGYDINFGIARAAGSFGYACAALFMGNLTEQYGAEIILPLLIGVYGIMIVLTLFLPVPEGRRKEDMHEANQPSSLKQFFHRYHRFMMAVTGFSLLWFMNSILGTYMIYFIDYYHGTAAQMSRCFSIMAFAEIPAIVMGSFLMRRMGAGWMLRVSAIGALAKDVLFFCAPDVTCFMWTNLLHFFQSGFYQVAAVYFCYSIVQPQDIVKGQSFLTIFVSGICSVAANYIGGILIDTVSIPVIYLVGIACNIAALVIIWIAVDPHRFAKEKIRRI